MDKEKKEQPSMFDKEKAIWSGTPIVFSRNGGTSSGLMIGAQMYTFNKRGALETCVPLIWSEMQAVVGASFKNPGPAMGAHARLLKMEKRNGSTKVERDTGNDSASSDKT